MSRSMEQDQQEGRKSFIHHQRNACARVSISVLLLLGIACACLALLSCRWYVFIPNEHLFLEDWDFLPDVHTDEISTVDSVGLFGYHVANDNYIVDSENECLPYPGLWVGPDHPWKFASQLCVVIGPIVALVAIFLVLFLGCDTWDDHLETENGPRLGRSRRSRRFWICTVVLSATGIQLSAMISSLSWCSDATDYWNCPWLLGSLINLTASLLFLGSWFVSLCLLVDSDDDPPNCDDRDCFPGETRNIAGKAFGRSTKSSSHKPPNRTKGMVKKDSKIAEDDLPVSEIHLAGEGTNDSRQDISVMSTESSLFVQDDIENGKEDQPRSIRSSSLNHECDSLSKMASQMVGCKNSIDGTIDQFSYDEKIKSAMKRISQSNQLFLDLQSKLDERNQGNIRDRIDCENEQQQDDADEVDECYTIDHNSSS